MPKSAVVNLFFEEIAKEKSFKKLSLFFDKIYIDDRSFQFWKIDSEYIGEHGKRNTFKNIVQELEWLIINEIVEVYSFGEGEFKIGQWDNVLANDISELGKMIEENMIYENEEEKSQILQTKSNSSKLQFAGVLKAKNDLIFRIEDVKMRIDALRLSLLNSTTEFVPILKSLDSYKNGKSNDSVLHFILSKIPTPDMNTSWEQLLDFRADENVKRKYYALVEWVNQMSRSEMPLAHVSDKYNQLYSEYVKQYEFHKLSSGFTTIELLVIGGVEFISSLTSQNYISAFRSMLNISKQRLNLMKAESEIQGRELAYIYSANQVF